MFQGDNPSTDLRGVGFLGLIQPLYFVTTPELLGLSKAIYKLSLSDKQDFPLMVLSINVTRIALHALRDDLLVRYVFFKFDMRYPINFIMWIVNFHGLWHFHIILTDTATEKLPCGTYSIYFMFPSCFIYIIFGKPKRRPFKTPGTFCKVSLNPFVLRISKPIYIFRSLSTHWYYIMVNFDNLYALDLLFDVVFWIRTHLDC